MSFHETKALDWYRSRQDGRRLRPHEQCDDCGEVSGDATWDPIAERFICQSCIEELANAHQ